MHVQNSHLSNEARSASCDYFDQNISSDGSPRTSHLASFDSDSGTRKVTKTTVPVTHRNALNVTATSTSPFLLPTAKKEKCQKQNR